MKKLILLILVLITSASFAQTFEGTIKWSIKSEITDPELKAKMEANKKQMNDPANQARMKQMQDQMNTPEMKKAMEANPQMKAQMERMMTMQQSGGMNGPMFPTSMTTKIKNGNTLTITQGGMMDTEVLYQKEKNTTFMINRQGKTASPMPPAKPDAKQPIDVKVTKTKETSKILNYTCTKYTVESNFEGKPVTQIFWTTTEIKDMDMKALANQRAERGRQMFYEQVEGVPLKVEINYPEMKAKMVMEVVEFKKESLKDEEFTIPADFKNIPPPMGMR